MTTRSPHILFCVLNWGLGHATRSIPIIEELLLQGAQVTVASDGAALELLKSALPGLQTIELQPYDVKYAHSNMYRSIAPQMPKIMRAMQAEKKAVNKLLSNGSFDAIINDNRYGIQPSQDFPSVFLTHQLHIKIGIPIIKQVVNSVVKKIIHRYSCCWIPDTECSSNLSGELSHTTGYSNIRFIGTLSRLHKLDLQKFYSVAAILSGPEPQRSYLEDQIRQQLRFAPGRSILVRGTKNKYTGKIPLPKYSDIIDLADAAQMNTILSCSDNVLARSGYSTIMDLTRFGNQAILVPTPGQTEQEYLATRLAQQNYCVTQKQSSLNLANALRELSPKTRMPFFKQSSLLSDAISDFLSSL